MEQIEKMEYLKQEVELKVEETINLGLRLKLTRKQVLLIFQKIVDNYPF